MIREKVITRYIVMCERCGWGHTFDDRTVAEAWQQECLHLVGKVWLCEDCAAIVQQTMSYDPASDPAYWAEKWRKWTGRPLT
ncbi:MAG: hypothetical protein D6694_12620 [Gammaproteobacteria bacterium]|nr:MAG: hypothetical protein D6694_12620 [Gammaproteobacteria bacterium]